MVILDICIPVCNLMIKLFIVAANSVKTGDHIGWGVHHSPDRRDRPDFDPRAEQIVLCYVVKNKVMQCFQMMLQPTGGFYPMVLLSQNGTAQFMFFIL